MWSTPQGKWVGSSEDTEENLSGEEAAQKYYNYVKKIRKINEKNDFFDLESSPQVGYIKKCQKQKIFPKPFGVFKKERDQSSLNLKNYSLGDKYASAISKVIKKKGQFQEVNLQQNRLSDLGTASILSHLSEDLKRLDLSKNILGAQSLSILKNMLKTTSYSLEYLNLENCRIGNRNFQQYFAFLSENVTIKYLNLAQNELNEQATNILAEVLQENRTLERLDLH